MKSAMPNKRSSSIVAKISAIICAMVVTCSAVIGFISYGLYKNEAIQSRGEKALTAANSVASAVNGDLVTEIIENGEKNEYWHEVKALINNVIADNGLFYMYLLEPETNENGEVVYVIDGATPEDPTEEYDFGDTDDAENFAEEMFHTIDTGSSTMTGIYETDDYGQMLSGYSAVLDSNNKVVGVVGVDISLTTAMQSINMFRIQLLVLIPLFSILFWLLASWYIKRSIGNPMRELSEASAKIAMGDLDISVVSRTNDEIGRFAEVFSDVAKTLNALLAELTDTIAAQNKGDTDAKIHCDRFEGAFRKLADSINEMNAQNKKDFDDVLSVVDSFGAGDFNAPLRTFPGKKSARNTVVENLRENLRDVSDQISLVAGSAAEGDLSKRIDESLFSGGWKKLAAELNKLLTAVIDPIEESSEVLKKMSEGQLDVLVAGNYKGDFAVIKDSLNTMAREISSYIGEIKDILNSIADRNLTRSINREYRGQFTEIKDSINNIVRRLNVVIGDIRSASEQVESGSGQLANASQTLASESAAQTNAVEDLNGIVTKISDHASLNAKNAHEAQKISEMSQKNASKGNSEMTKMLGSMDAIQKSSKNIFTVTKVIEDIAFQTNLLALNAAVEAARAGVYGKGFAVVAEEVRNLATRSQEAVKNTSELVKESIERVEEGTALAETTSTALNAIIENVTVVSGLINKISTASDEQTKFVSEISDGLDKISASAIQNSATSEEASALSEELSGQSTSLSELVNKFIV